MRAREFIDEMQRGRNRLPTNQNAIELQKNQYGLLQKRAEWLNKIAELRKKLTDDASRSSREVKAMAGNALKRRQAGIHGLREKKASRI